MNIQLFRKYVLGQYILWSVDKDKQWGHGIIINIDPFMKFGVSWPWPYEVKITEVLGDPTKTLYEGNTIFIDDDEIILAS